jgi:hypothetical protein
MFRVVIAVMFIMAAITTLGSRCLATYQDPQYPREYPCTYVAVECPDIYNQNSDIVFHAYTGYPPNEYKIKYRWTVWWAHGLPKGRIKSGRGTDTLIVSATRGKVTGIVRITGAPKECNHTASCTTLATLK